MGLLQRFARPEYQAAQPLDERIEGDANTQQGGNTVSYEATPPTVSSEPEAPRQEAPPQQPSEPAAEQDTMRVIAFANQKGGVAKTTTTLNLAVALAEKGHR